MWCSSDEELWRGVYFCHVDCWYRCGIRCFGFVVVCEASFNSMVSELLVGQVSLGRGYGVRTVFGSCS